MKTEPKITKQYILNNLLTIDGRLNNWKVKTLKETPKNLYMTFHNLTETPKCECGNETSFMNFRKGYREFCSIQCVNKSKITRRKIKETCSEKYDDENFNNRDKAKNTCLDKYDVENPFQVKDFKDKSRQTCLDKYGVEYYINTNEYKESFRQTCLEKYGVEHHRQNGKYEFGYKHKDYIYPSGKIVKIQGYENQLLDELLEIYTESEILTNKDDMPEFWYYSNDNSKHRYFPDVYIPKTGTIYEVKSSYTLNESKKNGVYDLKVQSVLEEGFEFELRVY